MDTTYSFEKENNSLKMKLKQHEEMGGIFFFFLPCLHEKYVSPAPYTIHKWRETSWSSAHWFFQGVKDNAICVLLSLCHPWTPYLLRQKNRKASTCKTVYLYNNITHFKQSSSGLGGVYNECITKNSFWTNSLFLIIFSVFDALLW